jgi:hypothetical protein
MPVARNEMVHKPLEIRNKTIDSQFT